MKVRRDILFRTTVFACAAVWALVLVLSVDLSPPKARGVVFRTKTCVHFFLEGREVGPRHELDGGSALLAGRPDVFWMPPSKDRQIGFKLYRGKDLERYHPIYVLTPEGMEIRGIVYFSPNEHYYFADFELPVRPGWSGSPVFDGETRRVIGLVSGIKHFLNNYAPDQHGIVCKIHKEFPEVYRDGEKATEGNENVPDGNQKGERRGK